MGDAWMGDDFFHQGAFRQSYGLEYSWMMEASPDLSVTPSLSRFDTYEWYRSFPTLGALAAAVGAEQWPTWRHFAEHPAYDSVWQARSLPRYFTHTVVPTLTVGGWWDQEDEYGPDPAHPVPYRPRPVERTYSPPSRWRRWETEDQRFVDGRPDVLTWQTAPLTEDVTVAGNIVAHLFAATTGSDADWVVKLI